ncbi:MAG: A/G-specific adenine glycosylase [Streptosporangiales bacterium]|nr:A/G-specific adenine glycosylase [Streptosporangiales bacterium]MBO0892389.1 A/G-specific adenine glycosylase [Acidothermales bacterium]
MSTTRRRQYVLGGKGPDGLRTVSTVVTISATARIAKATRAVRNESPSPGAFARWRARIIRVHTSPPVTRVDDPLVRDVLRWYAANARDLPWRRAEASPWAVLVSEIMLQQTPVARVLPAYERWLRRWPAPADLAAEEPGEAVRAWDRLGYPRRALRLHAAARAMVAEHGGRVPDSYQALLALPGVGDYTAAAVASFAFRRRHVVLDTNVRRVLSRSLAGEARPAPAPTAAERRRAETLLPADGATAARWAVAAMEFGALVCTARTPGCDRCPVRRRCAWRAAGFPDDGGRRRTQRYDGTDRQARGRLLRVLREAPASVPGDALAAAWDDAGQRARALDGLVADGLVEPLAGDRYRLPR